MSFQARYPGRCASCEERIHEGDLVKYESDEFVHTRLMRMGLVHAQCPVPTPEFTIGPRETICGQCFTIHNGECM